RGEGCSVKMAKTTKARNSAYTKPNRARVALPRRASRRSSQTASGPISRSGPTSLIPILKHQRHAGLAERADSARPRVHRLHLRVAVAGCAGVLSGQPQPAPGVPHAQLLGVLRRFRPRFIAALLRRGRVTDADRVALRPGLQPVVGEKQREMLRL